MDSPPRDKIKWPLWRFDCVKTGDARTVLFFAY